MVNMRFFLYEAGTAPSSLTQCSGNSRLFAREFLTGQEVADINAGMMGRYQAKVMVCSSVSYSVL